MLNISGELKNLYRNDLIPIVDENAEKDLEIYFPSLGLHVGIEQVVDDTFELEEKLCSEDNLRFGSCEASMIKFTLADVEEDLTGHEFVIKQIVEGIHEMPLGTYKVDSCKKQDNLRFKEIVAYDKLKNINVDVAEWYLSQFPSGDETYTLKEFRSNLLAHLGIEEEEQTLPNDDMTVSMTIQPAEISGRDLLEDSVELNGAFGHINRNGKFVRKVLAPRYGLYPSETLYPSNNLYPIPESDKGYNSEEMIDESIEGAMYQSLEFEDYTVKEIDKLQVRSEEADIGAIVGDGTNSYIIQGNIFAFGKTAEELEIVARKVYGNINKRSYRPFEAETLGLPYVEVGDALSFISEDEVTSYVLQRTLTGIQALRDNYVTMGEEEQEHNPRVNREIIQFDGRITRIQKDVNGVIVQVEDLGRDVRTEVQQLADQIVLKIDSNGNIGAFKLSEQEDGTQVLIKADNIKLEGIVTANGRFKILSDGSMEATNADITGTINSTNGDIGGWKIDNYGMYNDTIKAGFLNYPTLNVVIYAGGVTYDEVTDLDNWYTPNFYVLRSGFMEASSAIIRGYTTIEDNLWVRDNVSADSFTDRTPFYDGNALEELNKIRSDGKGNIDHSTLPKFAYVEQKVKPKNKDIKGRRRIQPARTQEEAEIEEGRDIGAMVSVLTKGIQELIAKNDEQDKIIKEQSSQIKQLQEKIGDI